MKSGSLNLVHGDWSQCDTMHMVRDNHVMHVMYVICMTENPNENNIIPLSFFLEIHPAIIYHHSYTIQSTPSSFIQCFQIILFYYYQGMRHG